ncbi:MAG: hypothetical protein P4L45_03855 [Ignavibacteriaceae bacterium]|nr:hypothetical protein [Ignavibacteriaceae bacterium]
MNSLSEDLKLVKSSFTQFNEITSRVLEYIPNVLDKENEYNDYIICSSNIAGTKKTIRPFRKSLFIRDPQTFKIKSQKFFEIITELKNGQKDFNADSYVITDSVLYTIQQAIGIGLDLMVEPNSARKHVGNRFEELIRVILKDMNISYKKVVLKIPYETDEGMKYYRCETDIIISPFETVRSNAQNLDPKEIIVSLKTTTKDRMPKIFIDKLLMEKFVGHPVKVVGISQNDIQRKDDKEQAKISYTFVSNLFMVYTRFLTKLEGYYYLDPPARSLERPFNQYIFPFSKFLLNDLREMLGS